MISKENTNNGFIGKWKDNIQLLVPMFNVYG